jgi:hypothetical protein
MAIESSQRLVDELDDFNPRDRRSLAKVRAATAVHIDRNRHHSAVERNPWISQRLIGVSGNMTEDIRRHLRRLLRQARDVVGLTRSEQALGRRNDVLVNPGARTSESRLGLMSRCHASARVVLHDGRMRAPSIQERAGNGASGRNQCGERVRRSEI